MGVSGQSRELLRQIPKVDLLLETEPFRALQEEFSHRRVLEEVRSVLEEMRGRARAGGLEEAELAAEALAARLWERLAAKGRTYYRRVVNGTGVVLHTGLGRAPLAGEVARQVGELAARPQRLEVDLASGRRGGREAGCASLLCELTGAEAATVVNNNAAATLLALAVLARGKEVILSRGEMVEIGGSYRVPEILREGGARLVEVGTTNRTHPRDYRRAIREETGLLLKVHTSNYRVVGFTREVGIGELVAIGREHGIPVVHDLGSGCLVDLAARGRPGEHRVQDSVAAGADLVAFSGDKLLGGPQAGILLGQAEAVERCRRHPMFRALRPGRLIYTTLEATLRLYLDGDEEACRRVPALRQLSAGPDELDARARRWAERLGELPGLRERVELSVAEVGSQAGSGSLPAREVPSRALRLVPRQGSAEALAKRLRRGEPPVLARLQDDALLLDLRTLEEDDLPLLEARLRQLADA